MCTSTLGSGTTKKYQKMPLMKVDFLGANINFNSNGASGSGHLNTLKEY
jgi:hypothetical protein